jgi:hypothetical protein
MAFQIYLQGTPVGAHRTRKRLYPQMTLDVLHEGAVVRRGVVTFHAPQTEIRSLSDTFKT